MGGSSGLTQSGSTERHDTVEGERPGLKLHVLVAGLHLHSTLTETRETTMDEAATVT